VYGSRLERAEPGQAGSASVRSALAFDVSLLRATSALRPKP